MRLIFYYIKNFEWTKKLYFKFAILFNLDIFALLADFVT